MWCAVPSSGLIMDRPGAGLCIRGQLALIVCRRENQVSVSRMQKASAMPPSWLRESFALRWRSSIHWALPPEKRYSGAPLSSRTASISQSAKGPARPVPAALRKASFAAKSAAALAALWALRGEGAFSESPSAPAPPGRRLWPQRWSHGGRRGFLPSGQCRRGRSRCRIS